MFYDELAVSSECACCQQAINGFGFECVECKINNPNFNTAGSSAASTSSNQASSIIRVRLCLQCTQLGAEVGPHKADHKYRIFDASGNFLPFPDDPTEAKWTAQELIRLLDAIEQYGFGNWHDISKHVETKTANECKDAYVQWYVKGSIGRKTWVDSADCLDKYSKAVHVDRPKDHTNPDEGPLSPSLTQRLQPLDIIEDEVTQLGYMPNRDDYEKEFDNDAEKLVCNLTFVPDDDDLDVSLKMSLVDMYTQSLRERARRKRVIRDYQLVSQFFKKERGVPKESRLRRRFLPYEREVTEKLKPFAQFHTSKEHEHFINNLVREKELEFRLHELYKYRSNGIKTQDDCLEYERLKNRKKATPSLTADGTTGDSSQKEQKMTMTMMNQTPGRTALQNYLTNQSDQISGVNDENSTSHTKSLTVRPSSCAGTNSNSVESKSEAHSSRPTEQRLKNNQGLLQEAGNLNCSLPQEELKATEGPFIVDIQDLPSFDLLSFKEQNLCLSLQIFPSDYLKYKVAIILDSSSDPPDNTNKSDWNLIRDFVCNCGWLNES